MTIFNFQFSIFNFGNREKGFTLIELMVALSITAVLGIFGIAGFTKYNQIQVLQSSADNLVNTLNLARSRAISQIKPSDCIGQLGGYSVVISSNTTYELNIVCSGEDFVIQRTILPDKITFTKDSARIFFPVLSREVIGAGTIELSGYGQKKNIIISENGIFASAALPTPIPTPTNAPIPTPLPTSAQAPTSTPAPSGINYINPGNTWFYFKGNSAPPANWNQPGFDYSTWNFGPSGYGYGDGDDATILKDMIGSYVSLYILRPFSVADPSPVTQVTLSVDYDDGFVAYLNGTEVARSNVTGVPPAFNTLATAEHEASGGTPNPQPIGVYDITAFKNKLVAGQNILAIQGHNVSKNSDDFSLIPSLNIAGTQK